MFSTILLYGLGFFVIGLALTGIAAFIYPPQEQQKAEWWLHGGMAVKRNKDGTSTLLIAKPKDEDLLED